MPSEGGVTVQKPQLGLISPGLKIKLFQRFVLAGNIADRNLTDSKALPGFQSGTWGEN